MLTSSSPWLFAGCHVLLRQSVPGHPPCALISLISIQKAVEPFCTSSFAFLCLLLSLFAFSRSVQLSRCVSAIPEDDIVFQDFQDSQYLCCAGLAPAVRLHPADAGLILILLLCGLRVLCFRFHSLARSRPRAMRSAKISCLPRKEVIQPHLPIRLPCYDFTPVIDLTFGSWSLAVTSLTSGALNSHGVTGGVYKARERIHRDMLIRDY